jgi:starch synthase
MKVLLTSSEVHPYSKTGGLGDMIASLGKGLAQLGHAVTLISPLYRGIAESFPELKSSGKSVSVSQGGQTRTGDLWQLEVEPNLKLVFVDQPEYFDRAALYSIDGADYPDNAERFIFFSKAVLQVTQQAETSFDILHAHDWQTALLAALVAAERRQTGWGRDLSTCLTVHNLAYQGVFPAAAFSLTGLPQEFFTTETSEFYGQFNCLKAGLATADALTTVSPRYAEEIRTPEFGCGLDGLLVKRGAALSGILNGVDYEEWQTFRNPHLKAPYSLKSLAGKRANKLALQEELGLAPDPNAPLFGSVTRLVEQKGVDLTLAALEELLPRTSLQYAMLGSGDPRFEHAYEDLARRHPGHVAVQFGYHNGLAHRIEAGSDFYLMPSRFEPCGLNQLYSLRYGSIPIVRSVGGLADSVVDLTESEEHATGIKFSEANGAALAHAIRKALCLYDEPDLMKHFQRNGMTLDYSNCRSAKAYSELYERLKNAKSK